MIRKLSMLAASVALCLSAAFAVSVATPAPADAASPCVKLFESSGLSGDYIYRCSSTPTTLGISNLSGYTVGLHNGCESVTAWPGTRSDWNDCISSIRIENLPGGYRVVLYVNSGYGFRNHCFDTNGTNSWNLSNVENDRTSSWRVEVGNC